MEEKIFSVSDYIKIINQGLKTFKSKIIGEVSEVSFGPTGHVYFSLKDEKNEGIINCVIWKLRYALYGIELKEGLKIIATGYPEIYAPWGKLSFISEVIEYAGEGTLKKEYEKLKEKLFKEGVFEEHRKQSIPKYPQRIGIITSRQGAVLADFLNNLARFGFKIKMIDSRVEGQAAIADLLLSIKTLLKENIEVLVIMRGGGSLESMLAFNNELLVREIIDFPVPVIAAIGHHKDVPLAALAADRSVSTPSIAAILINESWEQSLSLLREYERNIISSYKNVLEKVDLKNLWKKSITGFNSLLLITKQQLEHSEKIVYLRNPETQLKLGYSIARCNDKLIRRIKDVNIGKDVDVRVIDGTIISRVKNIHPVK
ncbi:MAG: exodeoxyribonuclease VII large subunit [Candidatus Nealsonbacteria bacterium]|nr:exodeoxyribonuclease VII large subunit [Candidatus Nealsonbacteria bacterium]